MCLTRYPLTAIGQNQWALKQKLNLRNFFPPTSLDKFNLPPPDPNINESRLNHYGIRANVGLDKRKLNWQPRIPDGDGISTSWTIALGCTGNFAAYVCPISINIRRVFGHAWLTLFGLFKPPREAAQTFLTNVAKNRAVFTSFLLALLFRGALTNPAFNVRVSAKWRILKS